MKKIGFLILIIVSFQSCKKQKVNSNNVFSNNDIEIELVDVEDSRCPKAANCFWEGDAAVKLKVTETNGDISEEVVLHTYESYVQETILFGYVITLRQVNPYPDLDGGTPLEDYDIILNVTEE